MAMIHELIPKVARDIGAIAKDRSNQAQGFKFRGIDDVYNAAHKPLCDHGVFVTTEVSGIEREDRETKSGGNLIYTRLMLKVTFHAPDGTNVSTITAGEAMDSADKSTNKAMSAALKYAFFQTFTIPLVDVPDADNDTHDVQPKGRPEPSPEQRAFDAWVIPLIDAKTFTPELVRTTLEAHRRDFAKTKAALIATLPPTSKPPTKSAAELEAAAVMLIVTELAADIRTAATADDVESVKARCTAAKERMNTEQSHQLGRLLKDAIERTAPKPAASDEPTDAQTALANTQSTLINSTANPKMLEGFKSNVADYLKSGELTAHQAELMQELIAEKLKA